MEKIGFGTFSITDENIVTKAIEAAIDNGYALVDTAKIYQNEKIVGNVVRKLRENGKKVILQTKIWPEDFKDVRSAFMNQRETLGTEIDIILLHRPSINFLESVKAWQELINLKKEGFVSHIGVSNFEKDMLQVLQKETKVLPEINQIELSATNFRDDRVKFCNDNNIKIQAWSPMGIDAHKHKTIIELAKKYEITPHQFLLAFIASQGICPLVKSQNPERIKLNLEAIKVKVSDEDIWRVKQEVNIYNNKFEESFPH